MLKRLSATLAPNSSSSSSSISPSQSNASSLDRNLPTSSTASTYHHHYSSHHSSSLSLNTPSIHDINTYPRPSGLSTPYSSSGSGAPELSPGLGYFSVPHHPSSSSGSVNNAGGLSPSLHSTTSRNVSPSQSPRLEDTRSLPSTDSCNVNYASNIPPTPIERATLQKSLRCLETLLVTMDEYRELSVRLSKVEKRLAKAGRELASSMMGEKGSGGNSKGRDRGPTSILQALHTTSNLFESLSEVSAKFGRHLSKEYDLINDLIGKSFKKIAKEERTYDDLVESLDSKLKKANYTYDKKIRSSVPGGGISAGSNNSANAIQTVHEQFVPILSSLTDEIKNTKHNHGIKMFIKRNEIVKETSKSLTCLSEIEFRKNCELVRKLGGFIGSVLAVQALLGPSITSTSGGGPGKGNGPAGEMPNYWPPELRDPDEHVNGALEQQENVSTQGLGVYQGNVHPLASTRPSSSEDLAANEEQQYHNVSGGRTLDDLLPPRAPFTLHPNQSSDHDRLRKGSNASNTSSTTTSNGQRNLPPPTNRSYSNISNGSSATTTTSRSISLNQLPNHHLSSEHGENDVNDGRYGSISAGRIALGNNTGQRSVSFPVEQMARPSSAAMDHDATVTMRNIHSKPTVDTSFFPPSSSPIKSPRENAPRRGTGDFDENVQNMNRNLVRGDSKEASPTYIIQSAARTPALQPALSYSPSQSGRVGYFSEKHAPQIREESEEADTAAYNKARSDDRAAGDGEEYARSRKLPSGFVMEEHSPEQYLNNTMRHARDIPGDKGQGHSFDTRSSPESANLSDSPTLSMETTGANTSTTSYSRNLNESYTVSPPMPPQSTYSKEDRSYRITNARDIESGGEKLHVDNAATREGTGAQLERSMSIESTVSEQSFVARMKARYAEEKEARRTKQQQQHQYNSPTNEHAHHASTSSTSAADNNARPSGRRVSTIAQKWEEKSLHGTPSSSAAMAALGTGRPPHNHQHRASMFVVPSMATSKNWSSSSSSSSSPHHGTSGNSTGRIAYAEI